MTAKIIVALAAAVMTVTPVFGQVTQQVLPMPSGAPPIGNAPTVEAGPTAGNAPTVGNAPSAGNGPIVGNAPMAAVDTSQGYGVVPTGAPTYVPSWTEQWTVQFGYVMGVMRPVHLPPLVTSSPAGTPQADAGVIGPGHVTSVLDGNGLLKIDMRNGFNVGSGVWFDDDRTIGCSAGFMWIGANDQRFAASSNGSVILARPFFDTSNGGAPTSLLVAFPNGSGPTGQTGAGSITVTANSGSFYDGHFDLQESIVNDQNLRLRSLVGYRYVSFGDGLFIDQVTMPTGGAPAPPPGTRLAANDNFTALNSFNGGEIGLQGEVIYGAFSFSFLAKVAAGDLNREIDITGSTLKTATGAAPVSTVGGLLTQTTNIGNYTSNVFTVIPEVGLNVTWIATANLRFTVGYSALVVDHAVRAADQIDLNVSSNLLTNPPGHGTTPMFSLQQSNVWLQTLNVGLEYRY